MDHFISLMLHLVCKEPVAAVDRGSSWGRCLTWSNYEKVSWLNRNWIQCDYAPEMLSHSAAGLMATFHVVGTCHKHAFFMYFIFL